MIRLEEEIGGLLGDEAMDEGFLDKVKKFAKDKDKEGRKALKNAGKNSPGRKLTKQIGRDKVKKSRDDDDKRSRVRNKLKPGEKMVFGKVVKVEDSKLADEINDLLGEEELSEATVNASDIGAFAGFVKKHMGAGNKKRALDSLASLIMSVAQTTVVVSGRKSKALRHLNKAVDEIHKELDRGVSGGSQQDEDVEILDEASASTIVSQAKSHLDAMKKAMDTKPWDESGARAALGGLLGMAATAATQMGDGPVARKLWSISKEHYGSIDPRVARAQAKAKARRGATESALADELDGIIEASTVNPQSGPVLTSNRGSFSAIKVRNFLDDFDDAMDRSNDREAAAALSGLLFMMSALAIKVSRMHMSVDSDKVPFKKAANSIEVIQKAMEKAAKRPRRQ